MMKQVAILLMVLIAFTITVSAETLDDFADINVEVCIPDEQGNLTWSDTIPLTIFLNDANTDFDITFDSYYASSQYGIFIIKDKEYPLVIGESKEVKTNYLKLSEGDIRITFTEMHSFVEDDTTTSDNENVIDNVDDSDIPAVLYVEPTNGDRKYLVEYKDGEDPNKINLNEYSEDSWWSSPVENDEVIVYIKRTDATAKIDFDVLIGEYKYEKISDNIVALHLENNGEYVIEISYDITEIWGKEKETDVKYVLWVGGIDKDDTNNTSDEFGEAEKLFDTEIDGYVGDTKTYTTTVDGEFTLESGVSFVNKVVNEEDGSVLWTFKFNSASNGVGEFREFEDEGNDYGYLGFNVANKPTPPSSTTSSSSSTTNNNNVKSNQSSLGDLDTNSKMAIGLIIVVLGIGIIYAVNNNKKKGGKGGNQLTSPTDSTGTSGL